MKNLQNNKTAQVIAIAVLLIVIFALVSKKGNNVGQNSTSTATQTSVNTSGTSNTEGTTKTTTTTKSSSGKCNFTITYPTPGSRVSFPLTVRGIISNPDTYKGNCLWYNVLSSGGTAQLFYNFNNYGWKSQGIAVPMITSGTQVASTTAVTVTLNFFNQGVGLPSGSAMRMTFTEFNPQNNPNPDTFNMTVYLK